MNEGVLLVGLVLVVLAAMLRTAYEGVGWVTRRVLAVNAMNISTNHCEFAKNYQVI